jgi:hypothetical protein
MFLVRLMIAAALLVVVGLGALYALAALVEPEQKETHIVIPLPKPKV